MQRMRLAALAVVVVVSVSVQAQQRNSSLEQAARAMGTTTLNSIEYAGNGYTYAVGQQGAPFSPWPRFKAKYSVVINFQTPTVRRDIVRSQGENPPFGGAGQPINGNQRQQTVAGGTQAWMASPHGLVKAAMASRNAKVVGRVVTFKLDDQDVKFTLNAQNLVERVEYKTDNNVLGDVVVETTYSDYGDFGGTKFPRHIVEQTDGHTSLDVLIRDVKPNAPVAVEVKPAGTPPAATVEAEKLADGVWYLNSLNYHSIAVEFRDHVVMFEGPISDARTTAVNRWVAETIPGKPIRYLVVTHQHFDHLGGVRAYVAAGATIITHPMMVPYIETIVARPHTIRPDALSKTPRKALFEPLMYPVRFWPTQRPESEKMVLTDGAQTLELYHIQGSGHSPWMIVGYLPKGKLLLEADLYNPVGNDPRDPTLQADFWRNFADNVQRLKLDVAQLVPIHGRVVPFDNLRKAIEASATAKPGS